MTPTHPPKLRRSVTLLLLILSSVVSADDVAASPPDPSYAQILAQLQALQKKVDALEAARNRDLKQSSAASQAEVDATVRRVMEDAEQRSRLLRAEGITAGFNGEHFLIRSTDGNFSLSPTVLVQFRYVANQRESASDSSTSPTIADGFENRRLRLGFDGNFFDQNFTYRFLLAADRGTSAVALDSFVQYQFTPSIAVRAGQFKDPWSHEEYTPDSNQLAVERSLLNALIGGVNTGWVQGVDLIYGQFNPLRTHLVFHDGANSRDTNFTNSPTTGAAPGNIPLLGNANVEYGATGRVEYVLSGDRTQYADFSAINNKQNLLVLGAGADYTQAGDNAGLFHAFDLQWENTHGTSAFTQYLGLWRQIDSPSTGSAGVNAGDFYDYGFLFQVGQMITQKTELFARYDWTNLDSSSFTSSRPIQTDDVQEITIGANYYLYKHNCHLSIDLSYLPNGSPDAPGLGYLATDSNSFILRTQLTLAL